MARPNFLHTPAHKRLIAKLKAARTEANLTQRDVAKKLRRLPNYVAKVEAGDKSVEFLELEALAKIYRKPLSFFQD